MDFTSELLSQLQAGKSVDDLAAELTKAINAAHAENERIKAAEAEAKRKAEFEAKRKAAEAEAARNDKIAAMDNLIDAIVDLLAAYEVDGAVLDAIEDTNPEQLVDAIDEALPAIQEYVELVSAVEDLREKHSPAPKQAPIGDPIEDFLNKFVR